MLCDKCGPQDDVVGLRFHANGWALSAQKEAVNDHQRSSLNQSATQLKRARTLLPGVDKFLGFRGAVLAKGVRRLRQLKMLKVAGKCAKTASYFPTSCLRYCSASSAMVSTVNC